MQSLTLHYSLFNAQWNIFGIISRTVIQVKSSFVAAYAAI